METKELQLKTLRVLQEYMPNVKMIPDLINRLDNQGLKELLPNQKETLTSLIMKSGKRKEIEQRLENITSPEKHVNTSNTSPDYFKSPIVKKVEEIIPIGFKIPTPQSTTITSMTPTSRVEMFDLIFNEQ